MRCRAIVGGGMRRLVGAHGASLAVAATVLVLTKLRWRRHHQRAAAPRAERPERVEAPVKVPQVNTCSAPF